MYLNLPRSGYYLGVTNGVGNTLVTRVDSIKINTLLDSKLAKKACCLQYTIGRPSTEDLIKYVKGNMIPNYNITREDIIHEEDIFSPNPGSLKVKTTRHPTENVHTTWKSVPKEIIDNYEDMTLAVDIIAIYKILFMVTKSRN